MEEESVRNKMDGDTSNSNSLGTNIKRYKAVKALSSLHFMYGLFGEYMMVRCHS